MGSGDSRPRGMSIISLSHLIIVCHGECGRLFDEMVEQKDKIKDGSRCPPPTAVEGDFYPSRYSVAFFAGPNPETNIEALPGTWDVEEEKLYPAVNARDFIGGGFKDLYGGERVKNEMAITV